MKKDKTYKGPKILTFDIESGAGVNGFKADLSVVLCIGYKWLHEDSATCLSVLDYGNLSKKKVQDWDEELLLDFSEIVAEADLLVGHYSSMFDIPFINGRKLIHKQDPLPPIKHFDTCMKLRGKAAFSSKRLRHLSKVLNLQSGKLDNNWPEGWIEVTRNPKKHVGDMIPYCIGDVLATEELYKLISPLSQNTGLFHVNTGHVCPKCASTKLQRRGRQLSTKQEYQRYQCQDCGSWSRDRLPKEKTKTTLRDL